MLDQTPIAYVMNNAIISQMSCSGIPNDSFSVNFTKIKADFTQQKIDSSAKGTGT